MFFSPLNDLKNLAISGVCAILPMLAAIDLTFVTAIILPISFFLISKAVDVCLQIYFRKQEKNKK